MGDSVRPTEDVLRAQFPRDVLALLTEWGQTALVRQMLNDLSAELGEPVSTDLLNAMLHEALVHDQRSIAALALELGANMEWYSPGMRRPGLRNESDVLGCPNPWKSLLIEATDEAQKRYLLHLIQKGNDALRARGEADAACPLEGGVTETRAVARLITAMTRNVTRGTGIHPMRNRPLDPTNTKTFPNLEHDCPIEL